MAPIAVESRHAACFFRGVNRGEAIIRILAAGAIWSFCAAPVRAADTNLEQEVQALRAENAILKSQMQQQGDRLDALQKKVGALESAGTEGKQSSAEDSGESSAGGFKLGKVNLSGEGAVGFNNTGAEGFAPNSNFRVNEARLYLDAPVWKEVYFYSEVDLATPENTGTDVELGELYLDFQDLSQLWGRDGQLNFRAGQINTPFGEEYLNRYAIDNPLISPSLPDLWGVNPGVELYGSLGRFSYVAAVQNGGDNGQQDYDGDKSVAGRISFDPDAHWHFSVSGMRTGNLNAQRDVFSAEWFGNGYFRSLGSTNTTKFNVNLAEADATTRWRGGHVGAFMGYGRYDDNDPRADNGRDFYYWSVEGVQQLTHKFYAAARFSEIKSPKGFPVVGYGNFHDYLFSNLSTELWRLSLGLGCRFSDQLVVKVEYSLERGEDATGGSRDHEDFFGTEAAFKF